ncbi:uncharacterized protein SPPG_06867 [Spizellomyces punctatus DAOM BR117]|uniref:FERM domain-containing protein n=1 Tax=Spizellomyces punctatus (strain DAOM BR117) TaxID=645134 RepID=A0A0L0HAE4_SPIPD|nr:uncharacterized protein SPPG_06867 [Spizellomyces punctatus DAOM BR117]KNC97874.1 hypothetical protein SPPG_06867 [Spizellomyces punctatus DAOM BR117]|eukprot:XP_016605914.1 hypothetical protein SPPG_06867 [Spizellomyces punctatus DAOM BR117]
MKLFNKNKDRLERQNSNPLLAEQALQRKNPAKKIIERGPEAAREAHWQPPLQRHIKPDDGSEFVTIRVRILNGDAEHDFNAKFPAGQLLGQRVCNIIADREGLPPEARKMFALWVVGKDLELQVQPDLDIFSLMNKWNTLVLDFTHYPEAIDPTHAINRHWFVYRREATVTKSFERRFTDDPTVRLLYGEAKRNVMTGRYVCPLEDAVSLGGIMLALATGPYDRLRHPDGYILKNDYWKTLIPMRLHGELKPQEWEDCLRNEHGKHKGRPVEALRMMYLEFVREFACYGCSFFPCCKLRPPAGFFEFRLQRWMVGISTDGLVVLDQDKNGYAFAEQWENLTVKRSTDRIILRWKDKETEKPKKLKLFTPQAQMIQNLALRAKYVALKTQHEAEENARSPLVPATPVSASSSSNSTVQTRRASIQASSLGSGSGIQVRGFTYGDPSASGSTSQGMPRGASNRDMKGWDMPPVYEDALRRSQLDLGPDMTNDPGKSYVYGAQKQQPASFEAARVRPPSLIVSNGEGSSYSTAAAHLPPRMEQYAHLIDGTGPTSELDAVDAMLVSAVADLDNYAPSAPPSAPPMDVLSPHAYAQTPNPAGIRQSVSTGNERPALSSFSRSPSSNATQPLNTFANSRRPSMMAFTAMQGQAEDASRAPQKQALGAFANARKPSITALSAFSPPGADNALADSSRLQESPLQQPSHLGPAVPSNRGPISRRASMRQSSFSDAAHAIPETSVYTSSYVAVSHTPDVFTAVENSGSRPSSFQAGTFGQAQSNISRDTSFNYQKPSITPSRSRSSSIVSAIAGAFKDTGVRRGADAGPDFAAALNHYL